MVYSARRFVLCLTFCCFVLVFFSPFSIAITSLGKERANLSAFRTYVRFAFVWFCLFPLLLGIWEGLRFVIVALPGLFSYLFVYVAISLSLYVNQFFFQCVSYVSLLICLYRIYMSPKHPPVFRCLVRLFSEIKSFPATFLSVKLKL